MRVELPTIMSLCYLKSLCSFGMYIPKCHCLLLFYFCVVKVLILFFLSIVLSSTAILLYVTYTFHNCRMCILAFPKYTVMPLSDVFIVLKQDFGSHS